MSTPYDVVYATFLGKIRAYDYTIMDESDIEDEMLGFMNLACSKFDQYCQVDLSKRDDDVMCFVDDLTTEDVNIISDGMIVYWLTPYVNNSDNLIAVLNSKDYQQFSPANLVKQVSALYATAQYKFTQGMKEYSYRHGDLTHLHI